MGRLDARMYIESQNPHTERNSRKKANMLMLMLKMMAAKTVDWAGNQQPVSSSSSERQRCLLVFNRVNENGARRGNEER